MENLNNLALSEKEFISDTKIEIKEGNYSIEINSNLPEIVSNQIQPISKKQMKKMKKQLEWESKKKDFNKMKKLKQKEKKKEKKLKIAESNLQESNDNSNTNIKSEFVLISRKEKEEIYVNKVKEGIKVLLDCDFENLMNDKDIASLVRQIAFCYADNKRAEKPFNFILYDIGPNIQIHLGKNNFENWTGVGSVKKGEYKNVQEYLSSQSNHEFDKNKIVYLSADSENEITELKHDEVYLIGGIVDRNRYKLITFNKAKELGIRHAKLPIGEYIHLNSSKVLTTNHVFQILSYFQNVKSDWKEAFMSIIPKRKLDE